MPIQILKSSFLEDCQNSQALSPLDDIFLVFPKFREFLLNNIKLSFFFKEYPFSLDQQFRSSFHERNIWFYWDLNFKQFLTQQALLHFPHHHQTLFSPGSFEALNSSFVVVGSLDDLFAFECKKTPPLIWDPSSLDGVFCLTLPDDDIFSEFLGGDDNIQPWMYDYLDQYFEYHQNLKQKELSHAYLYQVGGHGNYIQGSYGDGYIAQINADIGDGGIIFVYEGNTQEPILVSIDMH